MLACSYVPALQQGVAPRPAGVTPFNPPPPLPLPSLLIAAADVVVASQSQTTQSPPASASMDQVKAKLENAKEALFGQARWAAAMCLLVHFWQCRANGL